ncbi:hypothetical protein [Microbacterium sp.]|uniref:hypothetical protein n=1 Tax=Microbacterium sp. TaxID=51671 RepID=UPI003A925FBE
MPAEADADDPAVLARRLQILSTEHWGLLAARGTAQSEVLTRISIYLTLVSAGLVTIGLLGQASHFAAWFTVAALGILAFLAIVGLLTLVRVLNVAEEDFMYATAMNRIRGAYAEIDPTAAENFLASTHDDELGMRMTYSFFRDRSGFEQVLASSSVLSILVTASVTGMFFGGLVTSMGASTPVAVIVGVVVGVVVAVLSVWYSAFRYLSVWRGYRPLRPSDGPPRSWVDVRAAGRPSPR